MTEPGSDHGMFSPGNNAGIDPCPSCGVGENGTWDTHFDRSICACGSMHTYCNECGLPVEGCEFDAAGIDPAHADVELVREALNGATVCDHCGSRWTQTYGVATAALDRLVAERDRLREALEEIAIPEVGGYYGDLPGTSQTFREIASAALAKETT